MNIENKVNMHLKKFPIIKKTVKRTYQIINYIFSKKEKKIGDFDRITPKDNFEYFFGYYDKSPWDITERYMLCMRTETTLKETSSKYLAEILLIDTLNDNKIRVIGRSYSWNIQQGSMLQWLGKDNSKEVIYNTLINGKLCSIIYNIDTDEERVLNSPIYSLSHDGTFGLTLDFERLELLRPGYGYKNNMKLVADELDEVAIWKVLIKENKTVPLLKYRDFYEFEHRKEMKGAIHKVNHIMVNPSGNKFMVLHRWINKNERYSRLVTVDLKTEKMFNLLDDNMVSHCTWKNDTEILAFANKNVIGNGYFLLKDNTSDFKHLIPQISSDGHPSYRNGENTFITDTYPDKRRMSKLYLVEDETRIKTLGQVFSPFRYDNEMRCDLHPKWSPKGNKVSIDATFEGKRALYVINT